MNTERAVARITHFVAVGTSSWEAVMRKLVVWGVLAVIAAAIWAAVKYVPWWVLVLAVVSTIALGRWIVTRRLRQLLVTPFKLKGAVLRGATAEMHSIEMAQAPAADPDAGLPTTPRDYMRFDLTVTPAASTEGPFSMWEPGELRLVRAESHMDPDDPDASDDDDACEIAGVEIQHEGRFEPDEGWKLPGAQRVRLLVAVAPGVRRLKLRYYFEEFGAIELPPGRFAAVA